MDNSQRIWEQELYNEMVYKNPTSTFHTFEGESAVLRCEVRNKVGHCSWRNNGRLVYLYPGKYSWAGSPAAGDCSLRITKVAAQFDSGHWQCSVTATSYLGRLYLRDTLISDPVTLTVLYPPSHATIRVADDVR